MIKNIFFFSNNRIGFYWMYWGPTHNFKIRFNDIQGLRKNDRVFFDKTAIGEITGIEYDDKGNYLVSVAVKDQFSSLAKDSSSFYIDSNPEAESQKSDTDYSNQRWRAYNREKYHCRRTIKIRRYLRPDRQ